MTKAELEHLKAAIPAVRDLSEGRETVWINPGLQPAADALRDLSVDLADMEDAERRLARFADYIVKAFPETSPTGGIIESPLTDIPRMQKRLQDEFGCEMPGRLLLKQDSHLAISGSVKARGGIYEVLKHAEDLALEHGMLKPEDRYDVFASQEFHDFFSRYAIHVGSTGNLGLSIGIMSAALGFRVTVHMSADAKQWKKDLLRERGAQVIEYSSDYSRAVMEGRKLSDLDPCSYFVDDENSKTLFLGYAAAAKRLEMQLKEKKITVDEEHPLFVCIPCGVGGAPGGITFGLKQLFGDSVFCFMAEPVQAPCMLLGMATGLHDRICVQDIGLTGLTCADGLAVGRPSGFVGKTIAHMTAGIVTAEDALLYHYLRALSESEGIFIEPSACAAFQGAAKLSGMKDFLKANGLTKEKLDNSCMIAWATGGSMVPETERERCLAGGN